MSELRSRVITELGWSFEQVDACDWNDLMELADYWMENPPVHVLLAARYLDPKKRKARNEQRRTVAASGGEQSVVPLPRANSIPFDRLPAHVQAARMKDKENNAGSSR